MSKLVNPDDFVITRKRKKYKFAKFLNAENCFEFDEWNHEKKIDTIELGAGDGLFLLELAAREPNKMFAAIDVKADRLQRGAYQALERQLHNIVFIRARADQIDQLFPGGSLVSIWLTFSDPFPRQRSARRRLTHPIYLETYGKLLKNRGQLFIKHDNQVFFQWTLEQLVNEKWHISEISFDLHESELPDTYKILTSYEIKWLADGLTTNFVNASRGEK